MVCDHSRGVDSYCVLRSLQPIYKMHHNRALCVCKPLQPEQLYPLIKKCTIHRVDTIGPFLKLANFLGCRNASGQQHPAFPQILRFIWLVGLQLSGLLWGFSRRW